jgi:3-hydroxybutyryl-CoA dehydrogenase
MAAMQMAATQIAVVGAGIMGTGIAQVFAEAGLPVRLYGRRRASLTQARDRIAANQAELRAAGLAVDGGALDRITATDDLAEAVGEAAFVSENVSEDIAVKQQVFAELDRLAPPSAVLSTNTSGLSITAIAGASSRPERVVGLHWLNPPHLMPVVEVCRGQRTSDAVMDTTCELARRAGRQPIRVERDVPGFLVNRLQFALLREAFHLVAEGIASAEDVDRAVQGGLGLRWAAIGPFRVVDLAGLATFQAVATQLFPRLSADAAPPGLLAGKLDRGESGAAAGRGFHLYPPGAHDELIATRNARLLGLRRVLGEPGPDGEQR